MSFETEVKWTKRDTFYVFLMAAGGAVASSVMIMLPYMTEKGLEKVVEWFAR